MTDDRRQDLNVTMDDSSTIRFEQHGSFNDEPRQTHERTALVPNRQQAQEDRIVSLDAALLMTSNESNKKCGFAMFFQMLSFMVVGLGILSVNPLQLGFQFLEKLPNRFECREGDRWVPCTRQFICEKYADETTPS